MKLRQCFTFIKYMMFAFNFAFWLLGCAILGVGIWVRADPDFREYVESSKDFNYLYTGAYILITVGILVMVIGFLGCCGAIRENQGMLASFFTSLFIILSCLVATGIWAILAKDSLMRSVTDTLRTAVRDYDDNPQSKKFLDDIMTNFHCCGASGGAPDFMLYGHSEIPEKCELPYYGYPCDVELFNYFSENLIVIAGVAIGVAVVMVMGLCISMCLCCAIRQARSRERYEKVRQKQTY